MAVITSLMTNPVVFWFHCFETNLAMWHFSICNGPSVCFIASTSKEYTSLSLTVSGMDEKTLLNRCGIEEGYGPRLSVRPTENYYLTVNS